MAILAKGAAILLKYAATCQKWQNGLTLVFKATYRP